MRRIPCVLMLTALVVVGPVLAGCSDFDPDKLDVFGLNEKKKLPGERKEVFPGGVPGVAQGVPPEYMKGYQPPPDATADSLQAPPGSEAATGSDLKKTAAAEPAEETKPKPKPKARVASRPPKRVTVQPSAQAQQQQQTAPWPDQAQQPQQAQQSPWPAAQQQQAPQQEQSPWPAPAQQQQSTTAPWPSAPPAGTFSKQ
ncbi:MAG TPA: hypothetical protein VHT93_09990 [Pseudolabrys sp.]|jgi:hypothetical protein|nr:hypothetical protein [Pseudolabrys sp.]